MNIEELRKLVKKNGLTLHIKGTYDVSGGGCTANPPPPPPPPPPQCGTTGFAACTGDAQAF